VDAREFFDNLWQDYTRLTPQAEIIHRAFCERNGSVRNDHVAFRTFNISPVNLECLEPLLWGLGYKRHRQYQFEQKKLSAWGYIHDDAKLPLVFFSELLVEQLSEQAQTIIQRLVGSVGKKQLTTPEVFWAGRLWPMLSWQEYQLLLQESEYAAWLAALGFHANHFTIAVHHLAVDNSIKKAISVVKDCQYALNQAGGEVKGKPTDYLVQASTLADQVLMPFADGDEHPIATCYYEFAQRYRQEGGQYYAGFVAANADKIFESTNRIQR
jgi:hypothetical protein